MLELGFWSAVLASAVRLTVPVLYAALGELVAERSGVLNLGLEGMMIAGAFAGFAAAEATGETAVGIVAGVVGGVVIGAGMVVIAVRGRGNQIVTGLALTLLGAGLANFLYDELSDGFRAISPATVYAIPGLSRLPLVGEGLFEQNLIAWGAVALAVVVAVLLRHSRAGLEVVAVGHDPEAAAARGVSVVRVQSLSTLFAAGCAGLGGAALSLGALGSFNANLTGGRGFVAIAVVILGRWQPLWTVLGAFAFGFVDALQLRLQTEIDLPTGVLGALPWIVVLLLLVLSSRSSRMPAALGRNVETAR
jgi:simple sugar transport system permease protein